MKLAQVQRAWHEYNAKYFDNALQPITIRITRAENYYAKFVHPNALRGPRPSIFISGYLNDENSWRDALLHEMVHQELYEHGIVEEDDHGPIFREWAKKLSLDLKYLEQSDQELEP